MTLEAIRAVDVGSWFGDGFVGQGIPTLAEVLQLSRGRIKLYIELKPLGDNAEGVADGDASARDALLPLAALKTALVDFPVLLISEATAAELLAVVCAARDRGSTDPCI